MFKFNNSHFLFTCAGGYCITTLSITNTMTDRDTFLISEFWPDKIAQANKLGQKYTSKKGWHSLLDIAIAQSFGCYVHIQPNFATHA